MDNLDICEAVDRFLEQENIYSTEGARGVRNLAKLVNALGYSDFNRYGQQPGGYALGDIFTFLEDNSGAIEALIEWIKTRRNPSEWLDSIRPVLRNDADDEDPDPAN